MVTTSPLRLEIGTWQERVTSPLMCTEQAPHWATPQPYLVPVSPTCSRITHRRGVSGSTSTECSLPFTLSLNMAIGNPPEASDRAEWVGKTLRNAPKYAPRPAPCPTWAGGL